MLDCMMQAHHGAVMRTTIDIPEQDRQIFLSLARAQGKTLSQVVIELARRGLQPVPADRDPEAIERDPKTGLRVFRSGRPVSSEEVKAFLEDGL
jgi:hypothetical protein